MNPQKSKGIPEAASDLSSAARLRHPGLGAGHGAILEAISGDRSVLKAPGRGPFPRYAANLAEHAGQEQARRPVRVRDVRVLHVLVPSLLVVRRQVPGTRGSSAGNGNEPTPGAL